MHENIRFQQDSNGKREIIKPIVFAHTKSNYWKKNVEKILSNFDVSQPKDIEINLTISLNLKFQNEKSLS